MNEAEVKLWRDPACICRHCNLKRSSSSHCRPRTSPIAGMPHNHEAGVSGCGGVGDASWPHNICVGKAHVLYEIEPPPRATRLEAFEWLEDLRWWLHRASATTPGGELTPEAQADPKWVTNSALWLPIFTAKREAGGGARRHLLAGPMAARSTASDATPPSMASTSTTCSPRVRTRSSNYRSRRRCARGRCSRRASSSAPSFPRRSRASSCRRRSSMCSLKGGCTCAALPPHRC
jgi:hypothetical protein